MMNREYDVDYDRTDPKSIEEYSQRLIGKTFREILEADETRQVSILKDVSLSYGKAEVSTSRRDKGSHGRLIEERFFHYACNNDSGPDFYEAGVELKVTPFKINKDGSFSAKERLILTMIDYYQVVNEKFEESHLWNKCRLILLVYYLYKKDIKYYLDYEIKYSRLFTPSQQDILVIRHDYQIILSKIKAGKAHELSEGDTLYLGAAPKAATSKDRRRQPFSDEPAKPRAFAFKSSYMTYVLNNYIVSGRTTYEAIVSGEPVDSFENHVTKRIERYRGYSVEDLCIEFAIDIEKRPKNLEAMLAYRILGIKGNHAEEFEKANITVKTIRIGKNDKIKESMSFPTFRFKELVQEEWEDSTFGNYLREKRFLFVVYKFDIHDILRLRGCQFWNMPYTDLEYEVRTVWERTKQVLQDGLRIIDINGVRRNNFPKASENSVCHVRPHAQNALDTYELPDGRLYPKQCFWLNNTYIYDQLNEKIKIDRTT